MKAIKDVIHIEDTEGGQIVPASGVWWWAGFVTLGVFDDMSQITSSPLWRRANEVALGQLTLMLIAFLATLAICLWWYSRSKLLHRRPALPQLFGFLLFGLGTVAPNAAAKYVVFWAVRDVVVPSSLRVGIGGAAMIAIAYFLVFRRRIRVGL